MKKVSLMIGALTLVTAMPAQAEAQGKGLWNTLGCQNKASTNLRRFFLFGC